MRISRWMVPVVVIVLAVPTGFAEESAGPAQPTAEHQALEAFVGEWAGSGQLAAGPFGPGGPMSWTEECSWFGGARFHVVCRSEGSGPMGPMKGLGIAGYDPVKGVYTQYGIDTTGWSGMAEGTRDGDTWTYHSQETMEGKTLHTRFVMAMETPDRLAFTWSMSEDGETWTDLMVGTSERR